MPRDPDHWSEIEEEHLHDCRVFRVSRSQARSPRTGRSHDFFRIDAEDWVNIVPVTERGEVVMVRQYRHGTREITLEVPGGIVDPGETPAQAAARELLEETGYRAAEVVRTGEVSPNPAIFGNRVHSFAALDVVWEREVVHDSTEETVVELVALDRIDGFVRSEKIDSALVLAALHWFRLYHQQRP